MTVIPVEGVVPLDVASTEDIGACGGEEGIDGVLCMEGEGPEEGQHAEKEDCTKSRTTGVGCIFHDWMLFCCYRIACNLKIHGDARGVDFTACGGVDVGGQEVGEETDAVDEADEGGGDVDADLDFPGLERGFEP